MLKYDLNGTWKLHWSDGQRGGYPHYLHNLSEPVEAAVAGQKRTITDDYDDVKWLNAQVPGEVHLDLMKAGMIASPYTNTGVLQCRWVEECLWYYRRVFDAPEASGANCCELVFEGLDYGAVIYLNGEEIGRHANSFCPCILDISGRLLPKDNVLLIQLESGLFSVCDKPIRDYYTDSMTVDVLLHKRNWLRKTQSQMAWDWAPRLMNIGIFKPVYLLYDDTAVIESTAVTAQLNETLDSGSVNVRAFLGACESDGKDICLTIQIRSYSEQTYYQSIPADRVLEARLTIPQPELWWPVGYGKQAMYTVNIRIEIKNRIVFQQNKKIGFRRVTVNKSAHPTEGRYFFFEINHTPVFMKGANLVPSDIITAAITPERYSKLVNLALEANMNFLRIWGGGLYENEELYDLCNEKGILLWQEFIFACAVTPMTDDALLNSIKEEAVYNIRRLSHHPSLIAWCGNNEIGVSTRDIPGFMHAGEDDPLYDMILPDLLKKEDPDTYYQPTSPMSEDGSAYSNDTVGDQHPWSVGFRNKDSRRYEKMVCRFPNEGGILGPTSLPTMRACLNPGEGIQSFSWQVHDNMLDSWMPGSSPRDDVKFWLNRDMRQMTLEEYAYAGGFVQGEGLKRYIENFRRRKYSSSSAVFWMYNDCWPATSSWSVVDYYLNRTPSYYSVKRAFAPIAPVIALEDRYRIYVVNDTLKSWEGTLHTGLFTTAGEYIVQQRLSVSCPANTSVEITSFEQSLVNNAGQNQTLAFACLYDSQGNLIGRTRYTSVKYFELELPSSVIHRKSDKEGTIYSSDTFAMGVCLGLDGNEKCSDNMFDLYPGQPYLIKGEVPAAPLFILNNFLRKHKE